MSKNTFVSVIGMLLGLAAFNGCAKGPGTTITSQAYNSPVASLRFMEWLIPSAVAVNPVYDIKICVKEFKLQSEDGSQVGDVTDSSTGTTGGDSHTEVTRERKIGLVDLGDGSKSVDWGSAALPTGTAVKRLKIEIHHDPELCGVAYSASINGQSITKDIELKFTFTDAKTFNKSDSVTVALTNLITKLTQAAQAGHLDDSHIEAYLDGSFEDSVH